VDGGSQNQQLKSPLPKHFVLLLQRLGLDAEPNPCE